MLTEVIYDNNEVKVVDYKRECKVQVLIAKENGNWAHYAYYPTPDIALAIKDKLLKGEL